MGYTIGTYTMTNAGNGEIMAAPNPSHPIDLTLDLTLDAGNGKIVAAPGP